MTLGPHVGWWLLAVGLAFWAVLALVAGVGIGLSGLGGVAFAAIFALCAVLAPSLGAIAFARALGGGNWASRVGFALGLGLEALALGALYLRFSS